MGYFMPMLEEILVKNGISFGVRNKLKNLSN
jgi:hypothetical protein